MMRAYKLRLYPTARQVEALATMLETHRRLYNACLALRKIAYEEEGKTLNYYDQCKWYGTRWRDDPWYSKLTVQSARKTIDRVELAYQAFFRRVKSGGKPGFPRFKGRDFFNTIAFDQYPNGLKLFGSWLRVRHIPGTIRVRADREAEGRIKIASLTRDGVKWYVILTSELGEAPPLVNDGLAVGVDMGLESFLSIAPPFEQVSWERHLTESLAKLRVAQRSLARKEKGGANRRKARAQLAKVYRETRERRRDFHHKLAHRLVTELGLGIICVEKLDIKGMVERQGRSMADEKHRRRYARSILDAGWGQFLAILKYKCEKNGIQFIEVDARGTTQTCSSCGEVVPKALWCREHCCSHCGFTAHRDENSCLEILRRGLRAQNERVGPNGSPLAKAKTRHGPRISPRSKSSLQVDLGL
jgi:putative transposase